MSGVKKIDIIYDCEDCSNVWYYLGHTECCTKVKYDPKYKNIVSLSDTKKEHTRRIIEVESGIPDWCPLEDAI